MKKLFGGAGKNGSGKSTAFKILADRLIKRGFTAKIFTSSGLVLPILQKMGLNGSREDFNAAVLATDKERGKDWLAKEMCAIMLDSPEQISIWDGTRRHIDFATVHEEEEFSSQLFGYIDADEAVRYERAKKRGEKANEAIMSLAQFQKEDRLETNGEIEGLPRNLEANNNLDLVNLESEMALWVARMELIGFFD